MEYLTKRGERPLTADELSMLGDKAFAMKLEDHGGKAVYALSSAMIGDKDPNLEFIRQALVQLEKASTDPQIGAGDKIEMRNIAAELKARFPQIGEKMMTEAQMASWVRKNCKFAAPFVDPEEEIAKLRQNKMMGLPTKTKPPMVAPVAPSSKVVSDPVEEGIAKLRQDKMMGEPTKPVRPMSVKPPLSTGMPPESGAAGAPVPNMPPKPHQPMGLFEKWKADKDKRRV